MSEGDRPCSIKERKKTGLHQGVRFLLCPGMNPPRKLRMLQKQQKLRKPDHAPGVKSVWCPSEGSNSSLGSSAAGCISWPGSNPA